MIVNIAYPKLSIFVRVLEPQRLDLLQVNHPTLSHVKIVCPKRIKIDVLKSVLAGVWLRYSEKWDLQSFEIAKAYAYNCLQLSAENKLMDYNTVLNTVVHKRNYAMLLS